MREALDSLFEKAKTICILGHTRPDGDCLGSTLGWKNYLKARFPEKAVTVFLMEGIFLPFYGKCCKGERFLWYNMANNLEFAT